MAVVRLEIKTRQPLADGRKFDHVGSYEQVDGVAHFAVDPAHRLNCVVTDIDLAERGRDGLVHFTADVRIVAPADQARPDDRGPQTIRGCVPGRPASRSSAPP